MCFGGGGGGTTYSDVTQTTSNLPEFAEPYYKDLLARTGYETAQPYDAYGGDRLAYFSPMEQEAMARIGEMGVSGTPEELNQAGRIAAGVGEQWDANIGVARGPGYQAGDMGSAGDYTAGSRQSGYDPASRDSGYTAGQMGDQAFYEAGQREVGYEPGTLADAEMIQRYSDPYYQQVVDVEKREAARQADQRHAQTGLTSAGSGSLGGYREAIMRAENERNLAQQTGDIQTRGSQAAFQQAQQAFEADRSAQAQLEAFQQGQFGMNEQARQRMSELRQQGFGMNEAARQAQEEFAQGQFGMNQQAQQAAEQFQQGQFGMNEAARQFQGQLGLESYNAYENAKQQAEALGLQADEIEQAGQVAAANARLMQDQNRMGAAGLLGDFASQRQGMEYERLNAMRDAGMSERNLMQQGLDIGYQDFLRQQAYPREQLSFYSQMLQGTPIAPGQTTQTYGPNPSAAQQIAGTGIAGLGLYNALTNMGGQR